MQTEDSLLTPLRQQRITAKRIVKNWTEAPYDELTGSPVLTRSCVSNVFRGDIDGESWEEYLLLRRDDGSSSFVSLERFVGTLGDRAGSFVVQGVGTFEYGVASGRLTIVPGSGTGELAGLRGEGEFVAPKGWHSTIWLTYELSE